MKFSTHKHLNVGKLWCKFHVKIMSNVTAAVLEMAQPLKSKTANNIKNDYNLPLGTKSIAFSLKAHMLPVALIV